MNDIQKKVLLKEALHLIHSVNRRCKWIIGSSEHIISIREQSSQKLQRTNIFLNTFIKDSYFQEVEKDLKDAKLLIQNVL